MYYLNENIKNTYRVKQNEPRAEYLRLDMNENPEGLPREFFDEVIKKITPELLAMYPEKGNLLELLSKHNHICKECISLTNGSDEAMRLVFETFGCEGEKVLTVTPTFEMYDVYCNMFGMKHVDVSFDGELQVSVDDVLELIDEQTNIVVLLNPNSPIGSAYSVDEMQEIIQKAASMGSIVLIDEAYHYFYNKTFINYINDYDNVLVTRTFSKLCSLAGARIGYIAGNKTLIEYIENAQSTYNVNSIGLLFAEELLKKPEVIKKLQEIENKGNLYLCNKLKEQGYQFYCKYGNYILIKSKKATKEIADLLKKENILIKIYSKGILKDWIRITTGSVNAMEQFWNAFIKIDTII